MKHIREDIAEGMRRRIRGTPTFFVNGKKFVGRVPKKLVKQLLGEATQDEEPSPKTGRDATSRAVRRRRTRQALRRRRALRRGKDRGAQLMSHPRRRRQDLELMSHPGNRR